MSPRRNTDAGHGIVVSRGKGVFAPAAGLQSAAGDEGSKDSAEV